MDERRTGIMSLSPREMEVTAMLAQGRSHGEIAHKLGISVHTVRNYVQRAKLRTGCRSSLELAVKYVRAGMPSEM